MNPAAMLLRDIERRRLLAHGLLPVRGRDLAGRLVPGHRDQVARVTL
jgi:hypothetical protein